MEIAENRYTADALNKTLGECATERMCDNLTEEEKLKALVLKEIPHKDCAGNAQSDFL